MSFKEDYGFSLILALLTTTMITSLLLMLHLQIATRWDLVNSVDAQLYSFTLAESGIEYARSLIAAVDLDSLLKGADGVHSGSGFPEWRNPIPLGKARTIDPGSWRPERDDGIPFQGENLGLTGGYSAAGRGHFFLRFSNNPEEDPSRDEDQVILLRALGIAALPLPDPLLPDIRNSITLIEARFRKETTFLLPSPLTLFGDSGNFEWNGRNFQVAGSSGHGISIIETSTSGLYQDVLGSLAGSQRSRIRGQGTHPSISDITSRYTSSPVYRRLFEPKFWTHFEEQLPRFSSDPAGRIQLFAEGGTITGQGRGCRDRTGRSLPGSRGPVSGPSDSPGWRTADPARAQSGGRGYLDVKPAASGESTECRSTGAESFRRGRRQLQPGSDPKRTQLLPPYPTRLETIVSRNGQLGLLRQMQSSNTS